MSGAEPTTPEAPSPREGRADRCSAALRAPSSIYTEHDLQDLRGFQRFRREGLLPKVAVPVVIEFPDFLEAPLILGGERRCGDIDLQWTPSGWETQGRQRDRPHALVILHVVLRRVRFREPPRYVPPLALEPKLHGTLPTVRRSFGASAGSERFRHFRLPPSRGRVRLFG